MRFVSVVRLAAAALILSFIAGPVYAKCLGVSRTIHISKFNAALGTGAGGNIGLRHKEVVLTFDDGPVPSNTSRILSTLRRNCTKATFFVVGRMARAHPTTLRRVASAGHTIAHHTHTHANLPRRSISAAWKDIRKGMAVTNRALGPHASKSSKLFRYPYLARSSRLDRLLRSKGLLPFSASIDSHDWKRISANQVVSRVMKKLRAQGRGVILMHDLHARTASALPSLLRQLKAGGYKVVHVRTGRAPKTSGVVLASLKDSKKSKKVASKSKRKSKSASKRKRKNVDYTTTASIKKSKRSKKSIKKSRRQQLRLASLARSKKLLAAKRAKAKKRASIFALQKKKTSKGKKRTIKKRSRSYQPVDR